MQIDLKRLPQGAACSISSLPPIGRNHPQDVTVEGPLKLHLPRPPGRRDLDPRAFQLVAVQECSRCLTDFKEPLNLEFEVFKASAQPQRVSASVVDGKMRGCMSTMAGFLHRS
jgi:hypothetical protein